jgi:hypothetical protein
LNLYYCNRNLLYGMVITVIFLILFQDPWISLKRGANEASSFVEMFV